MKKILLFLLTISTLYSTPVRIMPLGDSITYDDRHSDYEGTSRPSSIRTGYRSHLYYQLTDSNYEVDFVGSVIAGEAITPSFDPNNEGHPGWSSYDISRNIYRYLSINPAEIVLLHSGQNDNTSSANGVAGILNEIDRYEANTGRFVRVVVALIIDGSTQNSVLIQGFNHNLSNLLNSRIRNGDAITVVDMYRGAALTSLDYSDGTHPNDAGYQKMATVWHDALLAPYNTSLHSYPTSIVSRTYIQSVSVDESKNTVSFIASVPDDDIIF